MASLLAAGMLADAAGAQTSATWLGGTGVWSNPAQWSSNPLFPCNGNGGQTFDVTLGTGTATLDLDCAIQAFTLSSGANLDGGFELTTNQLFNWSGGTMLGTGTTTANAGAALTSGSTKAFGGSRVLELAGGSSTWTAGAISMGGAGATLRIAPAATFTATGLNRSLTDSLDSATFLNEGTLAVNLDVATNALTLSPGTITNTGQVNVTTGILDFAGNGSHGGSFAGAGTMRFGGGVQSLLSGSSATTATTEVTGGSLAVQTGATLNVPSLAITFGTLEVVNAGTTANAGLLLLSSGGALTGAGALASSSLFTWSGGTMSGAGTTFANGGAALTTGSTKAFGGSRVLELAGGSSTWTAGAISMGGAGATLRIAQGATFTATGLNRSLTDSGDTATLLNEGTFAVNLDAATNVLTLSPGTITNTGQVNVTTGILDLAGNASHSGSFAGTGTMRFGGGVQSLLSGSSATTATTEVTGGSLAVQTGASVNVPSLAITFGTLEVVNAGTTANAGLLLLSSGGALTGAGALASSGLFTWSGGTMSGAGTTRANGGAALTGGGTKAFADSRRLELAGVSSSWSAGAIQMGGGGATFQTWPGSTLTVTGLSRALTDSLDSATFLNDGTFTLNLDVPGNTLTLSPGTTRNTGTLQLVQGNLSLTTSYTQTSGVTRLAGGALSTSTPLDIQGGTLEGVGTISGSVQCAGTLSPGLSPGQLTIAGNLTLQPGSRTRIELGGLVQGTSYDFADASGTVTLAGSLLPGLLPGFESTITGSDQFVVLERTSGLALSGAFANVASGSRVVLNPGMGTMAVSYGAGSAFGAQRVVLHDFLPIVPATTFDVSGTAQGGTIALDIEGVHLVIPTFAGQTAAQVAEAIAAAINSNAELAALGVVGSSLGASVGTTGDVNSIPVVTDAGLSLSATPSIPALPPLALALLALALLAVTLSGRERAVR